MKKFLNASLLALISISLLSGCSKIDFSVGSTEVAYRYTEDINLSERHNSGSDYDLLWPFQIKPNMLKIDYAVTSNAFNASYTLPVEEKISLDVKANVMVKLKKTPGELPYRSDDLAKFYTQNVRPSSLGDDLYIGSSIVYKQLMASEENEAFRSVFTDSEYKSFDEVEMNIPKIQKDIKHKLQEAANKFNLEIVGVKLHDLKVPEPIMNARNESLRLDQELKNQEKELEMRARMVAKEHALDVREALNDVMIDMIASQTDKGYQLIKVFKKSAENGNPMNVSLTPDFMRYIDTNDKRSEKSLDEGKALYKKFSTMSDQELVDYFTH